MNPQHAVNTFSYIWTHDAESCLRHLATMGFSRFELLLTAPHLWPADADAAARARLSATARALGATIVSLNAGGFDNNLASPAADVRRFAIEYLRRVIDLASDLGGAGVVMSPGVGRPLLAPPREWLAGWFRAAMDELVPLARRRGVRLLLENIPFAFLPRASDVMAAVAPYPAEQVGLVYDVANAAFIREDPVAGLATLRPRLALVHLSDTPLDVWRHDEIGTGVVDFAGFAAALRSAGYDGPLVFEIAGADPDRQIPASVDAWERAAA